MSLKIGVGVITLGTRPLREYHLAPDTLFLVYEDKERKGASHGRNSLMKSFYDAGCDYWFIFDDDVSPTKTGWEDYFANLAEVEHWDFFGMPEFFKDEIVFHASDEVAVFNQCLTQFALYSRKLVETAGYYRKFSHRYGFEDTEYVHRIRKLQEMSKLNLGIYDAGIPCPIRVMAYIHPDDVFGNNPSPYANVSAEDKQNGIQLNLEEFHAAVEDINNGKLFWSYSEAQAEG